MNFIKKYSLVILLLVLVLQIFLRLPFLLEPLEGDEGAYSSMAMWLAQGEILYKDLIDLKPPLLFFIYLFIFKVFGWSALSLRLFSLGYGLLATWVVFLLGRRLIDDRGGLVAALLYAVFAGGPLIEGAGANSEVFMVLPMLLGLYFFVLGGRRNYFLAGLFAGAAVMIKQVALFNFFALLGFVIIAQRRNWRSWGWLMAGFLLFPLGFVGYFWSKGALADFINAAFFYGFRNINPNAILFFFRTLYIMVLENSVLWLLALVGVIHVWFKEKSGPLKLLTIWGVGSFLGVYIGGYAFGHYYIQVIPALCLLSGLVVVRWAEVGRTKAFRFVLAATLALLALVIVVNQYKYYLVYTPEQISVAKYGSPVNVIAREIGQRIRTRTGPDDYVFPRLLYQIPLYAGRLSASKCYLSLGGAYQVRGAGGEILFAHDFAVRQRPELLKKENDDFNQALRDRRTKYLIYLKQSAPPGFARALAEAKYRFDRELSYPEHGVLVYKRVY